MPGSDKLNLFSHGLLLRQGQIFKVNVEPNFKSIQSCFDNVKRSIAGAGLDGDEWYEISREIKDPVWTIKSSALVFRFENSPPFLNSDATEVKIGYVLFMYFEHKRFSGRKYLFIQRRHIGDPVKHFDKNIITFDEIPHTVLFEPFSKDALRYEYLAVKPLSIERSALKKKTLASRDIRDNISTLGLNRSIPSAIKLVIPGASGQPERRISINSSTKRLQEQSPKSNFSNFSRWVRVFVEEVDSAREIKKITSSFLGAFAQPVASLNGLDADCLLIDIYEIRQFLRENENYKLTDLNGVEVQQHDFDVLLDKLGEAVPLTAIGGGDFSGSLDLFGSTYPIALRVLVKTCKLSMSTVPYKVISPDGGESLSDFLERRKLYRVTLSRGTILFSAEGSFKDGNIAASAQMLLGMVRQEAQLGVVVSEKGSASANLNFDLDSSFYVIRQNIALGSKWLICDDSKDEWCDFLSYESTPSGPKITWFHAKVKQKQGNSMGALRRGSYSASGLQEVVGQAIKNLGRLRLREDSAGIAGADGRATVWLKAYQWPDDVSGTQAGFSRLCTIPGGGVPVAADVDLMLKDFDAAAKNPNTVYEVAIVVPNYRLKTLKNIFGNLGKSNCSQTAPQIFWLLSGYMSSCIEVGARPVIYCL